jgi:hypothetical protein
VNRPFKFFASCEDFRRFVRIMGGFENPDGSIEALDCAVTKLIPEGHELPTFLNLGPSEAQGLMDALWDAGLRPTEGSGSAGALAATQRHLEDMRVLVFQKPINVEVKTNA